MDKSVFLLITAFVFSVFAATQAVAHQGNGINYQKRFDLVDHNNDGQLGKQALRRAGYFHNRVDVNDDGRIGKHEKRYARYVKNHAERNHDGRIDKAERHANRHRLNRVDRKF